MLQFTVLNTGYDSPYRTYCPVYSGEYHWRQGKGVLDNNPV